MRSLIARVDLGAVPASTHRAVVRVGAVGAWLCTALFLIAWLVTGNSSLIVEGIGPLATSVVFTGQILLKREDAVLTLLSGAAVVVVAFTFIGTPDASIAAVISLWVFAVTATFFVVQRPFHFLLVVALALAVAPVLWTGKVTSPLAVGLVLSLSFVITATLIIAIRVSSTRSETRFRRLFNTAPVALLEQEWSDAIDHLSSLGVTNETDLRAALADEEVLVDTFSKVRVLRMNAKAKALLGLDPLADHQSLPRDLVNTASFDGLRQQVVAVWQGKPRFEVEFATQPASKMAVQTWVRVEVVSTEVVEHTRRIVIAVTDITQLKAAKSALEELVRSKDEFIASISHELRTPLTGVLGLSAELLNGHVTDEDEREALLAVVVKQSEEVSYLVEDLLVGARADIGTIAIRPQDLDLTEEVEAVVGGMESSIAVEVRSKVSVWADPVRVRQIIRNLAVNAERYGGDELRAIVDECDGQAVFEMYDTGEPIPEWARERIFQPYGRAHRVAGTTASVGLGLAVSRQLAHLMGGSLEYHYDDGSVFRLTLPTSTALSTDRPDARTPVRH
jgi:signal transduction histidine kinase